MLLTSWLSRLLTTKTVSSRTGGKKQRSPQRADTISLGVTRLERRRVLNASPLVPVGDPGTDGGHDTGHDNSEYVTADDSGHVTIDAGSHANDGHDDVFHVVEAGDHTTVFVNDVEVYSGKSSDISQLTIVGSNDNDTLVVDYAHGAPLDHGQIEFVGGGQMTGGADQLHLEGGTADHVDHGIYDSQSGWVDVDSSHVEHSGVESIVDTISADHREFHYEHASGPVTLSDSPGDGLNQIDAGGTHVTFLNPYESLTVSTENHDVAAAQAVELHGLDSHFDADLHIHGDSADSLSITGDVSLGHGNLDAHSGQIDIFGSVHSDGGTIAMTADHLLEVHDRAALQSHGGAIHLDAGEQGELRVFGLVDVSNNAPGGVGGDIQLLGNHVGLGGIAHIDASGDAGGGTILIGGDYQGANPSVHNASRTFVGADVTISADAVSHGDGGKVIVWSDEVTRFNGSISATGGTAVGDGGFAEVSGQSLIFTGAVVLTAANGQAGTLLLDPDKVEIRGSAAPAGAQDGNDDDKDPNDFDGVADGELNFGDGPATFVIYESELEGATSNIVIEAHDSIFVTGTFVNNDIDLQDGVSLTLKTSDAAPDGGTGIDLLTDDPSQTPIDILAEGTGGITISSGAGVQLSNLSSASGDIIVEAAEGDVAVSQIATTGNVSLTATTGAIKDAFAADDTTVNVAANSLSMQAATGIGSTTSATSDFDITVTTVEAHATTSGDVALQETDSLVVGGTGISTAASDIVISTGGNLTLNAAVDAGGTGTVTLAAAGDISQNAAGAITANALSAQSTAGKIDLGNVNNDVNTLAAKADGIITYKDSDGLTVGTVGALSGIATTGDDIFLHAGAGSSAGSLSLQKDVSTGGSAGTVRLRADNQITQATGADGNIVAQSLAVISNGSSIDLTNANNDVDTFAAKAGGTISYSDQDGLTIGSIPDIAGFNSTAGNVVLRGITTTGDNVVVHSGAGGTAGGLDIQQDISTGGGDDNPATDANGVVRVRAFGDITQSTGANGEITAAALGAVSDTGSIALNNANNDVDRLAAKGGGTISFHDKDGLDIGGVSALGTFPLTNGVSTTNDDITIVVGGALSISSPITAGTATVTLNAVGDVSQSASGVITAHALSVHSTAGVIDLNGANNQVAILAAKTDTVGKSIEFIDDDDLTVGTVGSLSGVSTNNGNATIDIGGALNLDAAISAGTGTVSLTAVGDITQAAAGAITADELSARSFSGNIDLNDAANNVATLAASTQFAGKTIAYEDVNSLAIGNVASLAGLSTSNGSITVDAGGALAINSSVSAGSATVTITAVGDITQSATGAITANQLSARSTTGSIDLNDAANDVDTLAAKTDASGKTIAYQDADDLTIGSIAALGGIVTLDGDISIETSGSLSIIAPIDAGAGAVTLTSVGNVQQNASGVIMAHALSVHSTAGVIDLNDANNNVEIFAAKTDTAGKSIEYIDDDDLTVGQVGSLSGVSTNNGNATIDIGGALTLDANVSAGTGIVSLAAVDDITQSAAGVITADNLSVRSTAGNIDLNDAANNVETLAAQTDAAGKTIAYRDADDLTIGNVGLLSGVSTNNGNATIDIGGALNLDAAVSAGIGTVSLTAVGDITQSAAGMITADQLSTHNSAGNIDLNEAANNVETLAAKTDAAGNTIAYHDADDLTIGNVGLLSGVSTNNGNATIDIGGALNLDAAVSAGTGTVLLTAVGDITQTAAGAITADNLAVRSTTGNIDLNDAANNAQTLAARTDAAGKTIAYHDADDLAVGSVGSQSGLVTQSGDISVDASGALTITSPVTAGTGTVTFTTVADITQTAAGSITADKLSAHSFSGNIDLNDAANNVATLAARTQFAGKTIAYADVDNLAIGDVASLSGLSTSNGSITVDAGSALAINSPVSAESATVTITAVGDITQSATGTVTASQLSARSTTGSIDLNDAANDVDTLAAKTDTTGKTIAYADVDDLTVGDVGSLSGLSTQDGNITVDAGGALAINSLVSAGSATVTLIAVGDVTQSANGAITAGQLSVQSSTGNIDLNDAANDVDTLAAKTDTTGKTIAFEDVDDLAVGNVGSLSGLSTQDGNITVDAGGALTINSPVSAGTATVTLTAVGDITQSASGTIVADQLSVRSSTGNIDLNDAANNVDTLAARTDAAGKTVAYHDADDLTIGNVAPLSGIVTLNGDISVDTSGALTIIAPIAAGTGTVTLTSVGDVAQSASGVITGHALSVHSSAGLISLNGANNNVDVFAAQTDTAGKTIEYIDDDDLTVGNVGLLSGVSTNNGNATIDIGGALALDAIVTVGTGTVSLTAVGDITQTAAGTIIADKLSARSFSGSIDLNDAANNVTTLAARTQSAGKTIDYHDVDDLTIGNVGLLTGLSTPSGNITVDAGGALTINSPVSAGSETITFTAVGNITQSATGTITGGQLSARSTAGNIDLNDAANNVNTLAAKTDAAGNSISYHDVDDLIVGAVGALSGVTTAGGDIVLFAGTSGSGTLDLQNVVSTGSTNAGTARLRAADDVVQNANGLVTANTLGVRSDKGSIVLDNIGNDVATVAAWTGDTNSNDGVGTIAYRDANDFSVGTVGAGDEFIVTAGIETLGEDVTLLSDGVEGTISVPDNLGVDSIRTAGGDVVLQADNIALGTNNANGFLSINTGDGVVRLIGRSDGRKISLGAEVAGELSLTDGELEEINPSAKAIVIGGYLFDTPLIVDDQPTDISAGTITVRGTDPINLDDVNLTLITRDNVTDSGSPNDSIVLNDTGGRNDAVLTLDTGKGVGGSNGLDGDALLIDVKILAARSRADDGTGGSIRISDLDTLIIGTPIEQYKPNPSDPDGFLDEEGVLGGVVTRNSGPANSPANESIDIEVQNGDLTVERRVSAADRGNVTLRVENGNAVLNESIVAGAGAVRSGGADGMQDVHIRAGANILQDANSDFIIADTVLLEAGGRIGTIGNDGELSVTDAAHNVADNPLAIDLRANTVAAVSGQSGGATQHIFLNEDAAGGNLEVGRASDLIATPVGSKIGVEVASTATGAVVVTTEDGDLTISNDVIARGASPNLRSDGDIILYAGTADANFAFNDDILLNANVLAGGSTTAPALGSGADAHIKASGAILQDSNTVAVVADSLVLEAGQNIGQGAFNDNPNAGPNVALPTAIDLRVNTVAARSGEGPTGTHDILLNQLADGPDTLFVGSGQNLIAPTLGTIDGVITLPNGANGSVTITVQGNSATDGNLVIQNLIGATGNEGMVALRAEGDIIFSGPNAKVVTVEGGQTNTATGPAHLAIQPGDEKKDINQQTGGSDVTFFAGNPGETNLSNTVDWEDGTIDNQRGDTGTYFFDHLYTPEFGNSRPNQSTPINVTVIVEHDDSIIMTSNAGTVDLTITSQVVLRTIPDELVSVFQLPAFVFPEAVVAAAVIEAPPSNPVLVTQNERVIEAAPILQVAMEGDFTIVLRVVGTSTKREVQLSPKFLEPGMWRVLFYSGDLPDNTYQIILIRPDGSEQELTPEIDIIDGRPTNADAIKLLEESGESSMVPSEGDNHSFVPHTEFEHAQGSAEFDHGNTFGFATDTANLPVDDSNHHSQEVQEAHSSSSSLTSHSSAAFALPLIAWKWRSRLARVQDAKRTLLSKSSRLRRRVEQILKEKEA